MEAQRPASQSVTASTNHAGEILLYTDLIAQLTVESV